MGNKSINKLSATLEGLFAPCRRHILIFGIAIASLCASIVIDAAAKLIIRQVVDGAISGIQISTLVLFAGGFLFLSCIQGLFSFVSGRFRSRTAENIAKELRDRLFDHMQRLSFTYHDRIASGELVQRSTSDVDSVRRFYAEQIPELSRILFMFVINFATVAIAIDARLALSATVIVPVIGCLSVFFFKRIYDSYSAYQDQEAEVTSFVQEDLAGIRVVHAFTREKLERERFDALSLKQKQRGFRVVFWHTLYWPIAHFLCGTQFTLAVLFGGLLFISGELTAGSLIAFTFLMNSMIWPVQELGRIITEISRSVVSLSRINEIFGEEHESSKDRRTVKAGEIRGEIVFDNVGFSYADGSPAIRDVSFIASEGRRIALLGTTGSGKTTIVNLIPRFYDHTAGKILLDGLPIETYDRRFLRSAIGIVEQDPFLFSMTVAENIAYGSHDNPSISEIEGAARAAMIHETIAGFPEGYGTRIGEKGVNLSGGQKQRIAIARALLKKPRILILDDSMSAVDPDTERLIRNALDSLVRGRTTFVIAHRVRTLMSCDLILVLDEGRIVQRGTHVELVSTEGFYRDVFMRQTGKDSGRVNEAAFASSDNNGGILV